MLVESGGFHTGFTELFLFQKFMQGLEGLTAFRTEWTIFGEEEALAGSIDLVAQDSSGQLVFFRLEADQGDVANE